MSATLKYALLSEKKLSLVAKMIRGKSVPEALTLLRYLPKKAADILLKVVNSASANATNNLNIDKSTLYIKAIEVGK
jgi:large subunit ribosomal protein L22